MTSRKLLQAENSCTGGIDSPSIQDTGQFTAFLGILTVLLFLFIMTQSGSIWQRYVTEHEKT
ncbi:MAG TPA: hypothetical protein VKR42_03105 [Ktedonobacteraceae bacterium]|nr:hypothetical protein [Ktedonobacteraceae bacterium]